MGYCYTNGLGVAQDYAQAVEWYRKAEEYLNRYSPIPTSSSGGLTVSADGCLSICGEPARSAAWSRYRKGGLENHRAFYKDVFSFSFIKENQKIFGRYFISHDFGCTSIRLLPVALCATQIIDKIHAESKLSQMNYLNYLVSRLRLPAKVSGYDHIGACKYIELFTKCSIHCKTVQRATT